MSTPIVSPPAVPRRFWMLVFGAGAAPLFWLGQLILGYGVSAVACYRSDHPTPISSGGPLTSALVAFDVVAILAAAAGLLVSFTSYCGAARGSRTHFLAIWGVFSSLCFLIAIGFETIVSVTAPLCVR
jgi:hypothetical protein